MRCGARSVIVCRLQDVPTRRGYMYSDGDCVVGWQAGLLCVRVAPYPRHDIR